MATPPPPSQTSPSVILSQRDLLEIDNAMAELARERDEAKKQASYWEKLFHGLANCMVAQAKVNQPTLVCLGDLHI